jgi:hypothetical protein
LFFVSCIFVTAERPLQCYVPDVNQELEACFMLLRVPTRNIAQH